MNVGAIAGTEPQENCEQAFTDHRGVFSKILGLGSPPVAPPPATTNGPIPGQPATAAGGQPQASTPANETPEQKKKKGFFGRVFGGKSGEKDQKSPTENSPPNSGNNPPKE